MRLLLVTLLCGAVWAEAPPSLRQWEASPEAYFMTHKERREWESLKTDEDVQRFIDAFRARRGSDFSAEVRRRVEVVDERLALGEVKASTTLRGKIAILLGAPRELLVRHIPTSTVGIVSLPHAARKGGPAADSPPQPTAIGNGAGWVEYTFRYAPNPALGIGADGWTVVTEANAASGKDRLKDWRRSEMLDKVLEAAARRSIRGD